MFELIPLGNINVKVFNVTGDLKCFECVTDLCSAKKFLHLTTFLCKPVVQDNRSDSVG